ncbi:septal ring lytic transglycosylase RlpA family protein [Defluviicoccus vanus]|uniref:Endolytic peptidoglycan transglycosylase RlpA n=2 Tax=Defluviicoccus vanus TaxID=111831 RepID=A0A7H1N5Y5_9PROT|nr:septal ring lytic transglycosylase RlpA family protein [Defluviicoccus vanus]
MKGAMIAGACAILPVLAMDGTAEAQRAQAPVYVQQGVASWYGPGFHGRRTASGERFNQHDLTAAHKKLPLGTRVVVTNLRNGKSVEVEINDRGPYVRGRILDLSRAAAEQIDMKKSGVTPVRLEINEDNWRLSDRDS